MKQNQHLDEMILYEFLDGELPPDQKIELEAHLTHCAGCTARLNEIQALFSSLEDLPDLSLERDLSVGVMSSIKPQSLQFPTLALKLTFAVQVLIILLVLLISWPIVAHWIASSTTLQLSAGATTIIVKTLNRWSLQWQAIQTSGQDTIAQAAEIWQELVHQPILGQTPFWGLILLLVLAALLWLAGNGLLLRPNRIRTHPSSNGGKHG